MLRPAHLRQHLGLGRACLRQIQYDYLAVPKDEGRDFEPRTLRIFEAGHRGEDIVADGSGSPASTSRTERAPTAASSASRPSAAGSRVTSTAACRRAGAAHYPALWENKALGVVWKDVVKRGLTLSKPVYAAQIALYQAYLELPNPALFTALNRDTMELYSELVPFDPSLAQTMSDRAVEVVRSSDAGSCCRGWRRSGPRCSAAAAAAPATGTAPAPGRTRCWRAAA